MFPRNQHASIAIAADAKDFFPIYNCLEVFDVMCATVTTTTNPLPFQDLEPKRFEDLVRQLAYDFRPWRRLEATGRSGGDDGFDARGLEIIDLAGDQETTVDDGSEDLAPALADRLWLIQCKRERVIGPTKAEHYLDAITLCVDEPLHGLIFAAACDFSKKTRDESPRVY